MSPVTSSHVVSVNVGAPRVVEWFARHVTTAIWKQPVSGPVRIAGVNLDGDDQADRRVHGGPEKAVYAYAAEDYAWWSQQLDTDVMPGTFGENLTFAGVDLHACAVGEKCQVGTAQLRVTEPRLPCFKLGIRMGDAAFVDRFADAGRFGAYLAIDSPGSIAAGDEVHRLELRDDVLTIAQFIRAAQDGDPELLERLASHPLVSDAWRQHAWRALKRKERSTWTSPT
ncbi:MAG: MOSC domain-containing protein [Actinomycetota bacterium]|nr:MOSC domain-containing protein [Actinomycetota bacterium]